MMMHRVPAPGSVASALAPKRPDLAHVTAAIAALNTELDEAYAVNVPVSVWDVTVEHDGLPPLEWCLQPSEEWDSLFRFNSRVALEASEDERLARVRECVDVLNAAAQAAWDSGANINLRVVVSDVGGRLQTHAEIMAYRSIKEGERRPGGPSAQHEPGWMPIPGTNALVRTTPSADHLGHSRAELVNQRPLRPGETCGGPSTQETEAGWQLIPGTNVLCRDPTTGKPLTGPVPAEDSFCIDGLKLTKAPKARAV